MNWTRLWKDCIMFFFATLFLPGILTGFFFTLFIIKPIVAGSKLAQDFSDYLKEVTRGG